MNPEQPIYLIRHGEYDEAAGEDGGLTDVGREQAHEAAGHLREAGVVPGTLTLLTSSAPRTAETAGIIGDELDATPLPSERLYDNGQFSYQVMDLDGLFEQVLTEHGLTMTDVESMAVVNHAPLMGLVKGLATGNIGFPRHGEVVEYTPGSWVPLEQWPKPRR